MRTVLVATLLLLAGCVAPGPGKSDTPHWREITDPNCDADYLEGRWDQTIMVENLVQDPRKLRPDSTVMGRAEEAGVTALLANITTGHGVVAWWDWQHPLSTAGHPWIPCSWEDGHVPLAHVLVSTPEEAMAWLATIVVRGAASYGEAAAISQALQAWGPGVETALRNVQGPEALNQEGIAPEDWALLYADLADAVPEAPRHLLLESSMHPELARAGASIFYAPVWISGRNPDAYLRHAMDTECGVITLQNYDPEPPHNALGEARGLDGLGQVYSWNGEGWVGPDGLCRITNYSGVNDPTALFDQTLFAKAFGLHDPRPGFHLEHWYMRQEANLEIDGQLVRSSVVLDFSRGAMQIGRLVNETGVPLSGVAVRSSTGSTDTTDDDGQFLLRILPGDAAVRIWAGTAALDLPSPSVEDAWAGVALDPILLIA